MKIFTLYGAAAATTLIWVVAWRVHAHVGERGAAAERIEVARLMATSSSGNVMQPIESQLGKNVPRAALDVKQGRSAQRTVDELWTDPEYVKLRTRLMRRDLDRPYGALFRHLRICFPQVDIERLKTFLVEYEIAAGDGRRIAREQNARPETWSLFEQAATRDVGASLATYLGPAAGEFVRYRESMPVRAEIDELVDRLRTTEAPLTFEQIEKLVEIGSKSGNRRGFLFHDSVPEQAREVLNSDQYEALRRLLEARKAVFEMGQMIRAAGQRGADTTPGANEEES